MKQGWGCRARWRRCNDFSPTGLGLVDLSLEVGGEQEVLEIGVFVEGFFDFAEEAAADDAAPAPHEGDTSVVEIPFVFSRLPDASA